MCIVNMLHEFFNNPCIRPGLSAIYDIRTVFEDNETYFCLRDIFNTFDVPQYNFSSYIKKIVENSLYLKSRNFRQKGCYKIQFCNLLALIKLLNTIPRFTDCERIIDWATKVNKYYQENGFKPATTNIAVEWNGKEFVPYGCTNFGKEKEDLKKQVEEWKKLCEEYDNERKIFFAEKEKLRFDKKQLEETIEKMQSDYKDNEENKTEIFVSRQFSIIGKKSTEYLHEMVHLQKEIIDALLDERENLRKQILLKETTVQ